ncbi:hypothetical protein Tco_1504930 [Tanacetum coccineum]
MAVQITRDQISYCDIGSGQRDPLRGLPVSIDYENALGFLEKLLCYAPIFRMNNVGRYSLENPLCQKNLSTKCNTTTGETALTVMSFLQDGRNDVDDMELTKTYEWLT